MDQRVIAAHNRRLGRIAAKQALVKASKARGQALALESIEIVGEPGQKPRAYARGLPLPDFSISHSGGVAIAAVAPDRFSRIGIDIEGVRDFNPVTERAFLTEREYARVGEYTGEARRKMVTLHWCIKEAYLKAIGTGLRTHPRRIEITGTFEDENSLRLSQDGQVLETSVGWVKHESYLIAHVITKHE